MPNSKLDDKFYVREIEHAGKHINFAFYTRGLPNGEVKFYSLHPWEDVKKRLEDVFKKYDIRKCCELQHVVEIGANKAETQTALEQFVQPKQSADKKNKEKK